MRPTTPIPGGPCGQIRTCTSPQFLRVDHANPNRVASAPQKSQKVLNFCRSATPTAQGSGTSEIVSRTKPGRASRSPQSLSLCASSTPIRAEGRAGTSVQNLTNYFRAHMSRASFLVLFGSGKIGCASFLLRKLARAQVWLRELSHASWLAQVWLREFSRAQVGSRLAAQKNLMQVSSCKSHPSSEQADSWQHHRDSFCQQPGHAQACCSFHVHASHNIALLRRVNNGLVRSFLQARPQSCQRMNGTWRSMCHSILTDPHACWLLARLASKAQNTHQHVEANRALDTAYAASNTATRSPAHARIIAGNRATRPCSCQCKAIPDSLASSFRLQQH